MRETEPQLRTSGSSLFSNTFGHHISFQNFGESEGICYNAMQAAMTFLSCLPAFLAVNGQVAQLVEQRTENPRVGGSTPSLATKFSNSFELSKTARFELLAP
jgi:hypothetical protein